MTNNTGIIPTEYKVLVEPEKQEEKTKSGIIIPDEVKDRQQAAATKGKILDVSPLAFKYDDWPSDERIPKVGDKVAFARYAGVSIEGTDGENYRLVNDKDVIAILT
jgi:chaperonin GroES